MSLVRPGYDATTNLTVTEAQGAETDARRRLPEVNLVVIPGRRQYHGVRLVHARSGWTRLASPCRRSMRRVEPPKQTSEKPGLQTHEKRGVITRVPPLGHHSALQSFFGLGFPCPCHKSAMTTLRAEFSRGSPHGQQRCTILLTTAKHAAVPIEEPSRAKVA